MEPLSASKGRSVKRLGKDSLIMQRSLQQKIYNIF